MWRNLHQNINHQEAFFQMIELLEKVGIRDVKKRLNAYPHQLSGGQRQRVMIAMALANKPDLLIADEPTTALDVTIQAQILNLIKDIQSQDGMGLLFITHDLGIVQKIADRVIVMQSGKVVETGETNEIFKKPKHNYTKMLISSELEEGPSKKFNLHNKVVTTKDLKVWFPIKKGLLRREVGTIKALNETSLEIHAGETLGVVGESGSGKTTLGLAIMRLINSTGAVHFLGRSINDMNKKNLKSIRSDIQMIFQVPYGSLSPRMTILQIISEGLMIHRKLSKSEIEDTVVGVIEEVGLEGKENHLPMELSGGEQQRACVARALVKDPDIILADEPTGNLDPVTSFELIKLLEEVNREGTAILMASHNYNLIKGRGHRIIEIQNGSVRQS